MSNVEQHTSNATEQAAQAGVSRRKLMRAGLSAAPVLATLGSRSALATGTYGPVAVSAYCSLQNAQFKGVSHHPVGGNNQFVCKKPSECVDSGYKHVKVCTSPTRYDDDDCEETRNCGFTKPADDCYVKAHKKDDKSTGRSRKRRENSGPTETVNYGFEANQDRRLNGCTIEELCSSTHADDRSRVAKYCAAAWVSCEMNTDESRQLLTKDDIKTIWDTFCVANTSSEEWQPRRRGIKVSNVKWSMKQTANYLEYCYG